MGPTQRKTQSINLRMAPAVKDLLRQAVDREHRTLSNLLELLILEHCRRNGIEPTPASDAGATHAIPKHKQRQR